MHVLETRLLCLLAQMLPAVISRTTTEVTHKDTTVLSSTNWAIFVPLPTVLHGIPSGVKVSSLRMRQGKVFPFI